jgi:hypothetical protein
MPSKLPVKIKCPVDEMGKNSVKPSTTPMTAALMSKSVSTNSIPKKIAPHYQGVLPQGMLSSYQFHSY